MDIDLAAWRADVVNQRKTYVYGRGEGRGKLADKNAFKKAGFGPE